ncbi:SRPBCC family protein [Streptomyces sp. NPDC056161]|uniref:SRPBCC family protein n=1 Tax=Streptomyces sp. NPDC056161 TaxID=3345732 RepID=UPI0035D709AB
MADFVLQRTAPLPIDEAWRRLTRWSRHAGTVPLTRVVMVTEPPTRVGTRFVARTGLGPLGFDDPMEVTVWRPPTDAEPGLVRLVKRGRVVAGWAELEVRPGPGGRTRVLWREELRLRGLPALFDPPLAAAARAVFGREVNSLLRTA